mgnify:CR=1 FL=1|tara:strand:- start:243 stop:707 length:465 start_codon:yes stop_codon:yes gene_type:complete
MKDGPQINGNPLYISVGLLAVSYVVGEFLLEKYSLVYFFNMIGVLGLIISIAVFFTAVGLFNSYDENPLPTSSTKRIIKTGIFAYTRNPIYLSFILFFFSMFLIFENVMYFLSAIGLMIWLHHWVIKIEEEYLLIEFDDEYKRYKQAVNRWLFF